MLLKIAINRILRSIVFSLCYHLFCKSTRSFSFTIRLSLAVFEFKTYVELLSTFFGFRKLNGRGPLVSDIVCNEGSRGRFSICLCETILILIATNELFIVTGIWPSIWQLHKSLIVDVILDHLLWLFLLLFLLRLLQALLWDLVVVALCIICH